ncbi:outer membrane protein assembly factor BamE [Sphingomonas sp.]|uniref:outer membrane protein assembly factor BamE n=1 Tax=Sphingomonas sp. TaxID=28214 RepID=UPI001B28A4F9|nr:outer membrane protein assembly factor BamE [Sphingomonas sp.]MBO9712376.1 outer membrane protein assembly factor BamE [Sphingomonas sp.]
MPLFRVRTLACVALVAALGTTACTPVRTHQGYVVDTELVNSIQPGVDNRESVLTTLGQPTFTSQFNQGEWYYVSRNSSNFAFNNPRARDQMTLRVTFDDKGNVRAVDKMGADLIASVDPTSKKTPTLGRKRSFLEDLFGNIGTVGAPGAGPAGGGDGP